MSSSNGVHVVDTSVWMRVARRRTVADALLKIAARVPLAVALPVCLEVGFSARNFAEWRRDMADIDQFPLLPETQESRECARRIQGALWASGKVRAVGTADIQIAAIAIAHDATVLHYDHDFEHIAAVDERFSHHWIVPPGSIG